MKRLMIFIFLFVLPLSSGFAADVRALERVFKENFNRLYEPRFCGQNIARLIREANTHKIDLSNSYVLKIKGTGFLETSGFYTRSNPQNREMLGYFHVVFVADGYVFDFDLYEPLVLKLEDYIKLQFTPPSLPYTIFGIDYRPRDQLPHWTLTRYEWSAYLGSHDLESWTKKMGEVVDLESVLSRKRIR